MSALSEADRLQVEADFRQSARGFLTDRMSSRVAEAERTGRFPVEVFRECGQFGLFDIADEHEPHVALPLTCVWIEEAARICAGLTAPLMVHAGVGTSPIAAHGEAALRERYLDPARRGDKISAFALTESDAGSHVLAMKTRAHARDDGYSLSGSKLYITNAPICDYMVVAAYTDADRGAQGISLFVVDRDAPGVEVRAMSKHGHHSTETGEVFFEDVALPAWSLIGEPGAGYGYVLESLVAGRVAHAARSLGVARAALDEGVRYVGERRQFDQPLSEFQSVRFDLARACAEIEAAASYVYGLARRYDPGARLTAEAAIAKVLAADAAVHTAETALHLHGGYGYMTEAPVERLVRDARLYPVTEGTTEIQYELIAKALLRSPGRFGGRG